MGWHSTIHVGRACAVELLVKFVGSADDKQLGDLMDVLLHDRGYNCLIEDGEGADDHVAEGCLVSHEDDARDAEPRCRCGAGPAGLFKGTGDDGRVGWVCPRCMGLG